ncbi:MAG TPA: efflux RND transporter periplasmic adaptor subunit, partial [candidate division Zixibacteria bacterium]|nr:efflux RND transporter periplasmic adaptor subunit [candidate division Zixibacteria bacterium]
MSLLLKSKYSWSWIFLLLLIFLIVGCSKNQGGGFAPPPTPVEVAEVIKGTVADRFAAVGTLEAVNAITVVSQIDAVVLEIPFLEGSLLAKGDLIAQLDDAQLQAQKARAEALRDQRKISYDRVKSLVDQKLAATQELDDVSAALKIAEADLALIQAQLSKTKIVAPFTGLVGTRRVSPGTFLRSGDPITDLAQVDELRVIFYAPERYLPELR